jgi:beta-glucosidase
MKLTQDKDISKELFGDDFIWGISTAALQVEGSCDIDGKGRSIWDAFSEKRGAIRNGDKPTTACDFYVRYEEDINLVKELNIPNMRFSIAWSRILPNGVGRVNQAGIDHYNKVIDYCMQLGIEPWITLYHWDLPQALEDKGGWTNRDVIGWFTEFVTICAKSFGDRVKHWMVLNEPSVFVGAGYFFGVHAPGRTGIGNFLPALHHATLCMGAGGRIIREMLPDAQIGTTFSCSYIEPRDNKPWNVQAAKRVDALLNRVYVEPVLGLGYPFNDLPVLKRMEKYLYHEDTNNLKFDFDFIGIQLYTREIVRYSFLTPYLHANIVKAAKRKVPVTEMGWEVYPPAIYHMIKQFAQYNSIKKLYLTENGVAFPDELKDGKVDDPKRIAYINDYLKEVLRAKNEGLKADGYFVWTLTDNFEWAEGYKPRFGLIYVDHQTQQRIIKASGRWYSELIR